MCACLISTQGYAVKLFVALALPISLLSCSVLAAPAKLELADINGVEYSLVNDRGSWVVINYWATWCTPCLREIPELNKLYRKGKQENIKVIGVNFEVATDESVKKFVNKYLIEYPVLLEEVGAYSQLGAIEGLPKTFIISPKGEVVYQKVGVVSLVGIKAVIEKLKESAGGN